MSTQNLAISPIDGRYHDLTKELSPYFSTLALAKYRVLVEGKWLIFLLQEKLLPLSLKQELAINFINKIVADFDEKELERVLRLEAITKHDVKAIEYYWREKLSEGAQEKLIPYIHFGCTSEDINNLAYSLMVKEAKKNCWLPRATAMIEKLQSLVQTYRSVSMLGRTHGQPATPTTMGKELAVFVKRLQNVLTEIVAIKLTAKFAGATGTYAAFKVAVPDQDWQKLSKKFVTSFDLEFNSLVTQIEPHDRLCSLLQKLQSFNSIIYNLNNDFWLYISNNYFSLKTESEEIGSSVMPHKINPINFENSMANVSLANGIWGVLIDHLPISYWQRDLRDSSLLRNIGVGFAHTLIALKQTAFGLEKVVLNEKALAEDLEQHPEVLAEAIQTVLRFHGQADAYEQLKEVTKGKQVTLEDLRDFIRTLNLDEKVKERLLKLTPASYFGLAADLVGNCLDDKQD